MYVFLSEMKRLDGNRWNVIELKSTRIVLYVILISTKVDCKSTTTSTTSYSTLKPSTGNTVMITIGISTARGAPIPFLLLFSAVFGYLLLGSRLFGWGEDRACGGGGGWYLLYSGTG